jgi:hypothetical protein
MGVALTSIKTAETFIEAGSKVSKKDLPEGEYDALVQQGAIDPGRAAKSEEAPAEEVSVEEAK